MDRSDIEAALLPFARARPLPGAAFTSPAVLALEERAIFARTWWCAGHESELRAPGSWLRVPIAGERLIVVRGEDLELRALHDVCRHRGAPLCEGDAGRAASLSCPYHGWTYDLRGALRSAPEAPAALDLASVRLASAKLATWNGLVFVATDPDAPPLGDFMGAAPPWFAGANLFALRLGRRRSWETAANWKLVVENFQESHHFPRIHPELEARTPSERAASWLGPESGVPSRWLGGVMEIGEGLETVSETGRRGDRPLLVPRDAARRVCDAMLFPTLLTSLQPDYLLVYRLFPLAVDRTRIVADVFFHEAALGTGSDFDDVYRFWDRVNDQDRAICERQQMAASSRGFSPVAYAACEDGVHAFDRRVAAAYLDAWEDA